MVANSAVILEFPGGAAFAHELKLAFEGVTQHSPRPECNGHPYPSRSWEAHDRNCVNASNCLVFPCFLLTRESFKARILFVTRKKLPQASTRQRLAAHLALSCPRLHRLIGKVQEPTALGKLKKPLKKPLKKSERLRERERARFECRGGGVPPLKPHRRRRKRRRRRREEKTEAEWRRVSA